MKGLLEVGTYERDKLSQFKMSNRLVYNGPSALFLTSTDATLEIKVRDFAFPPDDPRHWGETYPPSSDEEEYGYEYANHRARALYDFQADTPSEMSFQEGDIMIVRSQQCTGWLVADMGEETGLVPENYVIVLGDDEEDEEDYCPWPGQEQDG
ncbi:812_t:CDS:2 [Paraglomus brasilianum]|uniref:812_t:CDS:1 n=1 Tax=Paraglomus brasilianum TaxID=144538 RepID=A0A9N9FVJ3_9GLOM|nr:812_t:CDS:2 [Paraglomus brasilianum]